MIVDEPTRTVVRSSILNTKMFQNLVKAAILRWEADQFGMYEMPSYKDLPSSILGHVNYIDSEKYLLTELDVWDETLSAEIYGIIEEHAPLLYSIE